MTKRFFFALLITALAAGGAFAQIPLSAGFGGFFCNDFDGGYDFSGSRTYYGSGPSYTQYTEDYDNRMHTSHFGGGFYGFFDVYFAELTVGMYFGEGYWKYSRADGSDYREGHTSVLNLQIGLLGKYPVPLTSRLTVFPLLGIDFALSLGGGLLDSPQTKNPGWEYNPSNPPPPDYPGDTGYNNGAVEDGNHSALWFKAGGGLDYAITRRIYIRFMALYGIRLPSKYETDEKASYEQYAAKYNKASNFTTRLGHGLDVKLAVGFKL